MTPTEALSTVLFACAVSIGMTLTALLWVLYSGLVRFFDRLLEG